MNTFFSAISPPTLQTAILTKNRNAALHYFAFFIPAAAQEMNFILVLSHL